MPCYQLPAAFGPGRRVPMCREMRARFRAMVKLARRPGGLSHGAMAMGLAMADILGADGRLDPGLSHLAERARLKRTAARDAINALRAAGFLTWERRLRRDAASGWRTEQATNAYVLLLPASGAASRPPVIPRDSDRRIAAEFRGAAAQLVALGHPIPEHWRAAGSEPTSG